MKMKDEIWTTRDGRKIAVADMSEEHVRNTLRMLLRNMRRQRRALRRATEHEMTVGDAQELLNSGYRENLRNPACYFPLLGRHGSESLYREHASKI